MIIEIVIGLCAKTIMKEDKMVGIDIFIAFGSGTVSGILAGVAVKLLVDHWYRPIIRIEDDDIPRKIDLTGQCITTRKSMEWLVYSLQRY